MESRAIQGNFERVTAARRLRIFEPSRTLIQGEFNQARDIERNGTKRNDTTARTRKERA